MAVSFFYFTSETAWRSFNDGSGDLLVSATARGADGLLAGVDYELLLEDDAGTDQDQANFAWNTQRDVDYTLSWDTSTETLTLSIENPEVPVTETLSWVVPANNQNWSVLSIRASVLDSTEAKTSRIQTLSTEFKSDLLGVYEIDLDGTAIAGGGETVNVVAIVAGADDLNENWTLTGSFRLSWGTASAPVVPAGEQSPGTTNPAAYPDGDNMTLTFGLSNPTQPTTAADSACLGEAQAEPPTCQEAIGDACFRYRYNCSGGEWILSYAECVDNSLCEPEQEIVCLETRFTFEERNTCFDGGTVPTPTYPTLTNGCFCQ